MSEEKIQDHQRKEQKSVVQKSLQQSFADQQREKQQKRRIWRSIIQNIRKKSKNFISL